MKGRLSLSFVGRGTIALCVASAAGATARAQQTLLAAGVELVYESGGVAGAPWRVELVEKDLARGGRSGCLRVRFAPGGPKRDADDRVTCEADGVLYAWDSAGGAWRASRPIRVHGQLGTKSGTNSNAYTATGETTATISGHTLRIIETTMVTTDSAGRQVRRLREHFAPQIGSATWGVFETPDPSSPGGWKVAQEFKLVAITSPPR